MRGIAGQVAVLNKCGLPQVVAARVPDYQLWTKNVARGLQYYTIVGNGTEQDPGGPSRADIGRPRARVAVPPDAKTPQGHGFTHGAVASNMRGARHVTNVESSPERKRITRPSLTTWAA